MAELNPFKIDDDRLDREWVRQPQLSREYGRRAADARYAYSRAQARADVVLAQLKLRIRKTPAEYGLDKVTEDGIKTVAESHPEYQTALEEMHTAKYALDVADAEVTAMVDRRKALERRVDLLSIEYFSEKEPRARTQSGRDRISDDIRRDVRGGSD